jgi:hypothetical protein
MSRFKSGDRVAIYSGTKRWTGTVEQCSADDMLLRVALHPSGTVTGAHPKQCRKLVKKYRRRVWLHCYEDGRVEHALKLHTPTCGVPCTFCREFVEVKRKRCEEGK